MLNPMEPTTAAVLAAMHFVRDDPTLRAESVKTAGLVRIDRGAYLDPSLLPITAKPWEVDRTVTKARCHALARRTRRSSNHPDRSAPILTGEAAMVAAGASTPNLPASPTEFQGLQLPSVPLLVADLARTSHPLSAYANISITFSRVTEFDNMDQGTSRARESALKSEILEALSPFGSTRAIAQIRTLTQRADAGAGSVWEAGFLWMLHCWLKPSIEWESQYHLTLDGLNY